MNRPYDDLPQELLSGVAGAFKKGILTLPGLQTFLGARQVIAHPRARDAKHIDYVVGWGHKETTRQARRYATQHGLPFIRLEDGFLRSVWPGRVQAPLSLVIDPEGIYYDARSPSRLERLIEAGTEDEELLRRASQLKARIVAARLSKYNHAPEAPAEVLDVLPEKYVLVVDQVGSDASVSFGTEGPGAFSSMLKQAVEDNPDLPVVVKGHPVVRGRRRGALPEGADPAGVLRVNHDINPHTLIERAVKVYVGTSQVGFEALLHDKPVVCFGAPFYSGWGLTDDRTPVPRRGVHRSIEQLVAAALLLYPRYVNPVTGERCTAEDAARLLELQDRSLQANSGAIYCFGFWWWKRRHARRFLSSRTGELCFCWNPDQARQRGFGPGARALVWGQKDDAELRALCDEHGVNLERMEDGFIRSIGLGSDLTAPWSLVVDSRGLYYDPRTESDLERLLATHEFSAQEVQRAAALRQLIVSSGLSKYNPSLPASSVWPGSATGERVLLVVGQVESDASVRLGSPEVRTNFELLRRVRRENPGALVVFKPHPDVLAGNRPGNIAPDIALEWCDHVVSDIPLAECFTHCNEIHTMSSLVGFEALLRGLSVVVYGQPFYAGWGLTRDATATPRRTRRLSLDELVCGTLVLYPRYVDPQSGYFCTAEDAVERLLRERAQGGESPLVRYPLGRPLLRSYHFLKGMAQELARV